MKFSRVPVEIRQAKGGPLVGRGYLDADPPDYVRLRSIEWTGYVDLVMGTVRAELDAERAFIGSYRGHLVAGGPLPTDITLEILDVEGLQGT